MVKNTQADLYEAIPRPVISVGNDYPAGHLLAIHTHRRAQLLYGASGVMMLHTQRGVWVIPPQQAAWIPAETPHSVRMMSPVTTRSIFVNTIDRCLPRECQALEVSPLMRSLLLEAADLPIEYEPESRAGFIMALIMCEIARLPVLPLNLPIPKHAGLLRCCEKFLENPVVGESIDSWSVALGMSRRTFTRLFKRETGLSFGAWCQQACLSAALPRLAAGQPVTMVAYDLGYQSPAAFTHMFKRRLGTAPSHHYKKQ